MAEAKPTRIVYLFGAGATHAELQNIDPDLTAKNRGLLVSHVSSRVIERARRDPQYVTDLAMVSGTSGSLNIELLISLIENSKILGWGIQDPNSKTIWCGKTFKTFFPANPQLAPSILHKALFELHEQPASQRKEKLTGVISLNYEEHIGRARTNSIMVHHATASR